jgi:hypothetical protein
MKIFILIVLLGVSTSGCENFLDLKPEEVVLEKDALETEEDLKNLMNSSYTVLGSGAFLGGRTENVNEVLSENVDLSGLGDEHWIAVYNRTTSIFNGVAGALYSEPYIAVFRANTVLENLSLAETDQQRNNLEGQARFVRAICHFETVRLFAQPYGYTTDNSHLGIPVKLTTSAEPKNRSTVKEVYDFVIDDLKKAESLLPDENNGYPTKWSAKAALARVYFQMNDFENAYDYANDVIVNSGISFNTSSDEYSQRFSQNGTTEATFQILAETQNNQGDTVYVNRGSEFGMYRTDVGVPSIKTSTAMFNLGTSNASDARAAWYEESEEYYALNKFNGDYLTVPYITITELKLTRAEAAAELNQHLATAEQDLQDIMDRAYGTGTEDAPSNAAALITEVRVERRKEFVGEGDIGQQLKRRGALGENIIVRGAPWDCPGMVLQFPQSEIANIPGFVRNEEGGCN